MKRLSLTFTVFALLTHACFAAPTEREQRAVVTVMLQDTTHNPLGSGVVVAKAIGAFWVATNQHVVDGQKHLCVVASNGRASRALVMPPASSRSAAQLDLALLWWPSPSGTTQPVSNLQADLPKLHDLPLVVASGYPIPSQVNQKLPRYTEVSGLLLPLLQQPLQGGFSLAYTAEVQKGMSGGGVFLSNRLIGINGTHPNPLWPGQWLHVDGRTVSSDLNAKLELVALGIPASAIHQLIKSIKLPDLKDVAGLSEVKCNNEVDQTVKGDTGW